MSKRQRHEDDGEEVEEVVEEEEDHDVDGDGEDDKDDVVKPRKGLYRQRAHSNPLANPRMWRPWGPSAVPLAEWFPATTTNPSLGKTIKWVDLGCGFGSLLLNLGKLEPTTLMLGMEIRAKPVNFVQRRIRVARREGRAAAAAAAEVGGGEVPLTESDNVWAVWSNSMKSMPNYFAKAQLDKIFICFPDPHFKRRNVRRRIVSQALLAEYAYCLREGGRLYTITDVMVLTDWMVEHLTRFPLFRRVPNADLASDAAVPLLLSTDEGLKVQRNNGNMFVAAFDRLPPEDATFDDSMVPREIAAEAAAAAGYKPQPGGEKRGKTW